MEFHSVEHFLGLRETNLPANRGDGIRKGLSTRCLKSFMAVTAASEEEIRHILWLSPEIYRVRFCDRRLKPDESDRLYRAAAFIRLALIHFKGDEASMRSWLRSPLTSENPVLPISLLGTEGGVELADQFLWNSYFSLYLRDDWEQDGKPGGGHERYKDPLSILGLRRPKDLDRMIRSGFSFRAYEVFQKRTFLSPREMRKITRLTPKAVSRMEIDGRLSADASDRMYRAAVVFYYVYLMLDSDVHYAHIWMRYKDPSLGNRRAIDLLGTYPEANAVKGLVCGVLDGMGG